MEQDTQASDLARGPSGVAADLAALVRHIAIVGVAGVFLGLLVGGIGARVVMRIAAIVTPDQIVGEMTENGNVIGQITVGGTIELLIFVGIFSGGIGAVAYVMSERWLSWTGPLRPIVFGLLLLAVASPVVLDANNGDFLLVGHYKLTVAMFGSLFLVYGIPLPMLVGFLERRLPEVDPQRPLESVSVYFALASLGLLFVLLLVIVSIGDNNLAAVLFLAMGIATLVHWAREYTNVVSDRLALAGRVGGYGAFIGAATAGTIQTWGAVSDILAGEFF